MCPSGSAASNDRGHGGRDRGGQGGHGPPIIWLGGPYCIWPPQYFALEFKILTLKGGEEKRGPTSKGREREGKEREGREEKGRGRKGGKEGERTEGREASWPPNNFYVAPPMIRRR